MPLFNKQLYMNYYLKNILIIFVNLVNYRIQWTDSMIKIFLTEIQNHKESFNKSHTKHVWKNIAETINTHGYNLTANNCYIKWTSMKKKYKIIKGAKTRTGTRKQTWKYFDIMDDILRRDPAVNHYPLHQIYVVLR